MLLNEVRVSVTVSIRKESSAKYAEILSKMFLSIPVDAAVPK